MESLIWKRIAKLNLIIVILLSFSNSGFGTKSTNYDLNSATDGFNHSIEIDRSHIEQFIVGGEQAAKGEFPSQVAVCLVSSFRTQLRCGGTIVGRHHCVTAGHCVYGLESSPEKFKIIAGITNVEQYDAVKDVYEVIKIWNHPNYESDLPPDFDIAVIKVSGDFADHGSLAPAALPTSPPQAYQMCTTCGWGMVNYEDKVISANLMKLSIITVDPHSCAERYYPDVRVDTVGSVCAGYDTGKSICNGDSGGPLLCNGQLVGVASWGHAKCGEGNYPSVFTKVYQHREFIRECMKQ